MLMLTAPLKRITSVNEPLQRGLAAAESVFELIDQEGERDRRLRVAPAISRAYPPRVTGGTGHGIALAREIGAQ